jgi:transcriptional regulator with GAF, ATPase, and Fis domain
MGEVFLARDLASGQRCAYKRLLSPVDRRVLEGEFRSLARIRHPTVVSVYEFGIAPDGRPYYTMEYVPGRPADVALRARDWTALIEVAAEIAHGLEVLHAARVIHGDLKPSNVLVLGEGAGGQPIRAVRLVDFGLAATFGDPGSGHRGTPGFAAPESVRGEPLDVAADLYGLGATLYTLAAGRPPFPGADTAAVLRRQLAGPPDRAALEDAGAPEPLVEIVLRLLADDPATRPGGARECRRELESLAPARRRRLADRLRTATVVGRDRELGRIEALLDRPERRSHVVLVLGPRGIGKTAFACEVAARAGLAGHAICRLTPDRFRDLPASAPAEPAAAAEPEIAPFLSSQIEALRADEAGAAPVCVVDDSHLLDPSALREIRRLVLDPGGPRSVWVMARLADEPPTPEERLLEAGGYLTTIPLGALERDAARDLVAARLREPPPAELEEFLWRGAGGHPGLTVEILNAAAAAGGVRETDAGLVLDRAALDRLRAPETGPLENLLRSLPPAALRVLRLLAVAGGAAADDLALIDSAIEPDVLEALVDRGLLAAEGGRFRVATAWWAERVLDGMEEPERAELHRQALRLPIRCPAQRFRLLAGAGDAAGALRVARESVEAGADGRLAAEAARIAEASDPVEAAEWHERAARRLFALGRYEAAVPHLDRSLELDSRPGPAQARLFLLVTAHGRVGQWEECGRALERLYASDPPEPLLSRALTNDAGRLRGSGRPAEAEAAARRALEIARRNGDDEAVGHACQSLVYSLLGGGRVEEAAPLAEEAHEAFVRAGSADGALRAGIARADVARARNQIDEALRVFDDVLARARAAGNRLVLQEVLVSRSVVLNELGRLAEVRNANAEAARLAMEDQRPRDAAIATANLAVADALLGRLRSARREARAAIRLARSYLPALEPAGWRALAHVHRSRGRLHAAGGAAARALELAVARSSVAEIGWCRLEYGAVLAARHRPAAAAAVWQGALAETPGEMASLRCRHAAAAGIAALQAGDADRAGAMRAVAEAWVAGLVSPLARAAADHLRAELLFERGGDDREALRAGQDCLRAYAAVPAPVERAHAALSLAARALERPLPDRVVGEWIESAAEELARAGDRRGRERALDLLVRWMRGRQAPGSGGQELIEAVSEMLISLPNLRELSHSAMELVVRQLEAERGVFLVVDPESGRLTPMAEHGSVDAATRRDAIGYSRRVVRQVARSGGSMLITDASRDPRAHSKSVAALRIRSILCVPLHAGGRVVGAVYVDDSRRPRAFDETDQRVLERTAKLLAAAIDRSQSQRDVERTNELLVGENLELRREAAGRFQPQMLVGSSLAMRRILPVIERAAQTNATVLVSGENGTGKELIARIIHFGGRRRMRPFVTVNCGAIPETLLESELFGILPNVATGVRGRDGRFRLADGGTLFLDEIGDMPLRQQVALLSAIANREITPVGGGRAIPVDVRIIAATNRDLGRMVEEGRFREDLFYRLNVLPITVPPLRERKSDLPELAQHFAARFAALQEREVPALTREFLALLMRSDWPGNVRELQNYIERVMALTPGRELEPLSLPRDLEARPGAPDEGARGHLLDQVADLERRLIEEALRRAGGNQTNAARELGLLEQALRYRMAKHGIPSRQNRRVAANPRRKT